ncbi:MAG: redoxin domain-containing protein [Ardenticatenaceae bacterium]|nr:redoxin domain-containing protein [Ardenticatenaceae bacterium]
MFFYPKRRRRAATQACGFRNNYPVIESNGATVLGISPDMPEDCGQMARQRGSPMRRFPIRSTKWRMRMQYGAKRCTAVPYARH